MPQEGTDRPPFERTDALERVAEALERRPADASPAERPPVRESAPPAIAPPPAVVPAPAPAKTPLREDIEAALADGLDDIYAALPSDAQERFRIHGERLAARLEGAIASGKIVVRQIHQWIVEWLRLIPHRAKAFTYFLVQEAKVKTDAILAIGRRSRGDAS